MQRSKCTAEFKAEAVKQVVDKGHTVVDVASRLGLGEGVLYNWVCKSLHDERWKHLGSAKAPRSSEPCDDDALCTPLTRPLSGSPQAQPVGGRKSRVRSTKKRVIKIALTLG